MPIRFAGQFGAELVHGASYSTSEALGDGSRSRNFKLRHYLPASQHKVLLLFPRAAARAVPDVVNILPTVGSNYERHSKLQRFMLANDSVTVAVEIPIWLSESDIAALETQYGVELVPQDGNTIGSNGFCNVPPFITNLVSSAPLFNLVNKPLKFLQIIIRPRQHPLNNFLHLLSGHPITISHPSLPFLADHQARWSRAAQLQCTDI